MATAPAHWGLKARPETPDPMPVEIPVGHTRPQTLEDIVARLIHIETQKTADANSEKETPEEADDFDMPDDLDEMLDFSPYELPDVLEEAESIPLDPQPPLAATPPETLPPEASPEAGKPEPSETG